MTFATGGQADQWHPAPNGEVEGYQLTISEPQSLMLLTKAEPAAEASEARASTNDELTASAAPSGSLDRRLAFSQLLSTPRGILPSLDVSPLLSLVTSAPPPATTPTVAKLLSEAQEERLAESGLATAKQLPPSSAPALTGSLLSATFADVKDRPSSSFALHESIKSSSA